MRRQHRQELVESFVLESVVLPVLREAEDAFSAELARINVEDLARSAAALQNSSEHHNETPHRPEESLPAQQEHSNANGVFKRIEMGIRHGLESNRRQLEAVQGPR